MRGDINKVKYYVCEIDQLLDSVLIIWSRNGLLPSVLPLKFLWPR